MCQGSGCRRGGYRGLFIEDFSDTSKRSSSPLHQVDHPAERDHGPHQHCHISVEHDEAAEADAMFQNLNAASPENAEKGKADQRLEQWLEDSL